MENQLTLLNLGHLKWSHVWQRPQQLMSRFAERCRVIYVDPPELSDSARAAHLREQPDAAGVRLLCPVFPTALLDTPDNSYQELWLSLLPRVLAEAGPNTILWVSSPLADYLVHAAEGQVKLIVYDCMDDLASFRDGTAEMRTREAHLLEHADLVFTGGFSMYEARKDRHPQIHCFPSGVDAEHYRQVHDPNTQPPASIAHVPRPRLGYFGVLDERIDWPLIAEIAERRPAWHWLLVGPTAKVEPEALPAGPNIHYLGQQQYRDLPGFLKGFDIATMPFALSEATRFISPTKTLEYLAGGKPVISSSVPDVVAFYKEIVAIADGVDAWLETIEQLLAITPEKHQARLERARPALEKSSWDSIVARMWEFMDKQLPNSGSQNE